MSENYRRERIERLLDELRYEVTRGILECEIDEQMVFRFIIPISRKIPDGCVFAEFRTRPRPGSDRFIVDPTEKPRLSLVKSEDRA